MVTPGSRLKEHAIKLIQIPAGSAALGSERHYPEDAPVYEFESADFEIGTTPVTNAEFRFFVAATGYTTVAERELNPGGFPGANPANLVPGSVVFVPTKRPVNLADISLWWHWVPGASWQHPTGPTSTIDGLENHPVVHIAFDDAQAYAMWAGLALPTEPEWEYAARAGLDQAAFTWGDAEPGGAPLANTWLGEFPWRHQGTMGTSPVGSYPPNAWGLFDMAGNVWEWTQSWWQSRHSPCCAPDPDKLRQDSEDPLMPGVGRRVLKGGSHLCAPEYCLRYRPAARIPQAVDSGTSHVGFRCIRRKEQGIKPTGI